MQDIDLINYQMFQQVSITLHKNESIWGSNPLVVSCVVQFDKFIKDIHDADRKLSNKTKSLTVGKKSFRKSITSQAFLIKDNMRLYYRSSASDIIGNNFLYFELDDYNNITVFNNGLLETLFTEDTDILIILKKCKCLLIL